MSLKNSDQASTKIAEQLRISINIMLFYYFM